MSIANFKHLPYLSSLYIFSVHAANSSVNLHVASSTSWEESEHGMVDECVPRATSDPIKLVY